MKLTIALVAFTLLLVAGCAPETTTETLAKDGAADSKPVGSATGTKEEQGTKSAEEIDKLKSDFEAAQNAYSSEKNDENKAALVKAGMAYADVLMYESDLLPKDKYPPALRAYRVVVKADPTNTEAGKAIDTIERIYTDMGRPIPE